MELFLLLQVITSWCFAKAVGLSEGKFGFHLKNSVKYVCPDLELTEQVGTISSPFYPNNYPSHLSCSWHIRGHIGDIITLTFDDVDIEESCCCESQPCCLLNWLKIGPLINETERKFCGKDAIHHHTVLLSGSNKLWVKFHISEFKRGGRGFRFHYKIGPNSSVSCKGNEFKCPNNECIPAIMRCNGFPDCEDESDEHDCSNRCASGQSCRTEFQCFEASKHCDGIADCQDFSDEVDCGFCEPNFTKCGVNSTRCYNPVTQRCDRVINCLNGEDELDCSILCPGKIMCDSGRGCYSIQQRCNGVTQCEDKSDEKNCEPELCNYEHGGFLCENGRCIQEIWTCDRTNDCGDGSDEKNCLRNSVLTAALMGSLICALLLVIAISCTCRLHALRMLENRLTTSRETPLSRMSREFFFREPPPSYAVAVQSEPHRSLCVENLHYGIPVHRGRRRGRRSRHSRVPYRPHATGGVPDPANTNCTSDPPTISNDELQEGGSNSGIISDQSQQQNVDKSESSVTDSGGPIDSSKELNSSKCSQSTDINSSPTPESPSSVPVHSEALDITGSLNGSADTSFYCDSDTDPLVV